MVQLRLTKKRVLTFIIIILISGWIGVLINIALKQEQGIESLGCLLWVLTPLVVVILFRTIDHEWKIAGILPHFKGNGFSYSFAILCFPILTLFTVGIGLLFGQVKVNHFSWESYLVAMVGSVAANFFRNISEEIAWRGYLTQKLFSLKLKDWKVYVITGLVWNLWHGAYYLIFTPIDYLGGISRWTLLTWGCVLLVVWSVMYGELYRRTQSIWPCVIMHAFEDGVPTLLLMSGGFMTLSRSCEWILHPITGVLSVVLILATGIYLNKRKTVK